MTAPDAVETTTDAPDGDVAETPPLVPVGTVYFTFPLVDGADKYHIYVGGTPDTVVEVHLPRRFWFGHRKVAIPVPGQMAQKVWTVDMVTGSVENHDVLRTHATIPEDQEYA